MHTKKNLNFQLVLNKYIPLINPKISLADLLREVLLEVLLMVLWCEASWDVSNIKNLNEGRQSIKSNVHLKASPV